MQTKKRVLLTGIGGSIGVHFYADIMTNTNFEVVGIDSWNHRGYGDRVKVCFDDHPDWIPRTTIITHDLIAPFSEITKKKIGKIDIIISMAAMSDVFDSILHPREFIMNNTALTVNLLEYAREIKPEWFVNIGTDEVYGPTDGKTFLKEWSSICPSNSYSASKANQENACFAYWRSYPECSGVILINTMNNFGEMQSSNKFPVIVQKKISKGEEVEIHAEPDGEIGSRSFLHSRNFASAVRFIIKNTKPEAYQRGVVDRPPRYNIAGDKQLTNLELAQLIAKLMGKELEYKIIDSHSCRPGHDPHYGLDDSKLKALGWKPPVPFEESLKNVIDWQTKNKEWL